MTEKDPTGAPAASTAAATATVTATPDPTSSNSNSADDVPLAEAVPVPSLPTPVPPPPDANVVQKTVKTTKTYTVPAPADANANTAAAAAAATTTNTATNTTTDQLLPNLGRQPVSLTCPHCHQLGLTVVDSRCDAGSGASALILGLAGCFCCICFAVAALLPCCVDKMQMTEHRCGKCHRVVGTVRSFSDC
mmetsp:Transcript_26877/g.77488  ORF Transcript_26877/g.77488 Transcript_26877/m.77488 type:complete len:192 (+) Transcript_26877:98-673(+)